MSTLSASPSATDAQPITAQVTSELGHLQQVIVHTPGEEMELVSPDLREQLLFEDILFVGHARQEHLRMCAVFDTIIGQPGGVLEIGDLLREAFREEDARLDFIDQLCSVSRARNLQAFEDEFKQLTPDELHRFALTGQSPLTALASPIPNLMFTRDVAAVVHDHVILSHPATAARARESIITDIVLRHHPRFASLRDRIIKLPAGVTFEGGDLLVASPEVVLIGHSERTSYSGIVSAAQALFEKTPVEHVVMVDLPKQRYCMHLDTVFTFCSRNECTVFPPAIDQHDLGNVVHLRPSDDPDAFLTEVRPSLKQALEELLGRSMTFIPCGGDDLLSQQREQWTDGANFFAPAPGVVVGYERNHRTFEVMREHGYRVVSARHFLSYHEESRYEPGEKLAIKLDGHELSRGRGGPRCMTMPVARKEM